MSGSREFYYEEDGKRQDRDLHGPILEDGDAISAFGATYDLLKGKGWTDERIEDLYGDTYRRYRERNP